MDSHELKSYTSSIIGDEINRVRNVRVNDDTNLARMGKKPVLKVISVLMHLRLKARLTKICISLLSEALGFCQSLVSVVRC